MREMSGGHALGCDARCVRARGCVAKKKEVAARQTANAATATAVLFCAAFTCASPASATTLGGRAR